MFSQADYDAARRRSATIDRADHGRLAVSGPDRASYLQGLLTNDVVALEPGLGCYAAYLTPQGRMITDMFVYELGDLMLIALPLETKDTVLERLNQFIFSEDVAVADMTDGFAQIAVIGPEAADRLDAILDGASGERLAALPEHGNTRVGFDSQPAIVTRTTDTGEPGFDIYLDRPGAAVLASRLAAAGIPALNEETAEAIRIEAGVPRFGRDMDAETIPLEAGIEPRAISFTKGCYVGQEVIIRVLHRGHGRVARKLAGLALESSSIPRSGAPVRVDDREVGSVSSGAWSPALKRAIALGYLHRDYLEPETRVSVDGVDAVVTPLPFVGQ